MRRMFRQQKGTIAIWLAALLLAGGTLCAPLQSFATEEEMQLTAEEEAEAPAPAEAELPQEEVREEAAAADMGALVFNYGTAYSESGLHWDGNGNLTLTDYKTEYALGIATNHKGKEYHAVVTVNGDCQVGMIFTSSLYSENGINPEEYITRIHLTITGTGTLRFLHTGRTGPASAMVSVDDASLTVENVTLDMVSTSTSNHGHAFQVRGDHGAVTIKNCKISTTLHSGDSYGIWTTYRAAPVTMENVEWTVKGTNEESDSYVIYADKSLVTLKNVIINASGKLSGGINAHQLEADHLTLHADLKDSAPAWSIIMGGRAAVIRNSTITGNATSLISFTNLVMHDTVVNATARDYSSLDGQNKYFGKGIIGTDIDLQASDITLHRETISSGSSSNTFPDGFMLSGDSLKLRDTKVTIRDTTGEKKVGMLSANAAGMTCYGNTAIDVQTQAGYAFSSHSDTGAQITLHDGLAVLTPASGRIGQEPGTNSIRVVLLDGSGQVVRNLKIGKGTGWQPGGDTGGWKKDSKGWWYQFGNGTYPRNKWERLGGKWYHFDASGYMQTGWKQISGRWYFLHRTNGSMVTGWVKDGGRWYFLNSNGEMMTGWVKDAGRWYYLDRTGGNMRTGWIQDGGKWYYLEPSTGAMIANTSVTRGGKTYHFDGNGVCTNP